MIVKLLTEHHMKFLSLKGGCRVSSESTHVKMPHCWKYHALAQSSLVITQHTVANCTMTSVQKSHLYSVSGTTSAHYVRTEPLNHGNINSISFFDVMHVQDAWRY